MQSEIRELWTNLSLATGTMISSSITRLEVDVRKLAEECIRVCDTRQETVAEERRLSDLVERSASTLNDIQTSQLEARDVLRDMLSAMSKLNVDDPVDRRFDEYIQPAQSSNADRGLASKPPNTPVKGSSGIRDDSVLSAVISGRVKNARLCPRDCLCPSHSRALYKTPQLLQYVTGRLFLGYNGRPVVRKQCLSSCRQRESEAIQMTYFFPRWFVQRAISVSMNNGLLGTPTFNIKIRRLVPEMSNLFSLSRYGDVDGLRNLFVTRQASPDDVHCRGGWTAIHFAVDHGCVEACRLLLDCGADLEWEDATGTSPIEIAWRNILHLRAPPQISDTFATLFPGTEFLQERRFTRLHRLAIELESGDVEKEIKAHPEAIGALDIDGWTPLHWAARRGNFEVMTRLLSYGADPLLPTANESRNALHLAAQGNSIAYVQRLLQYRKGNTMLDIDGRDGYGNSPLRISAGYNCAAVTAKLIELGADLNATDGFNEPPLLSAVYENAHETITQMLRAGADYTIKTKSDNSILHFAANEADPETLSLLTKARMRGVEVEAKNADGLTADMLASQRDRAPTDFRTLFARLIASIEDDDDERGTKSVTTVTSGGESWKSFEDSIWFEAEDAADVDVMEKDQHAPYNESSSSQADQEKQLERQGVGVEDMAQVHWSPEDMV